MTTVEYTTSFEDFKAAQALYLRSRRGAGIRFKLWMYGLPILSLVFTAGAIWDLYTDNAATGGTFGGLAIYSIILTIIVVVLRPLNLRRVYRKKRKLSGVEHLNKVMFGFDDQVVRSGYPGRSEGQFHWGSIVDYAEDEKIFLLFISQKMFLYIPKRAMNEEQWQELHDVLRRNGKVLAC